MQGVYIHHLKGWILLQLFTIKIISIVALASVCCSCGTKELSRAKALELLKSRPVEQLVCGLNMRENEVMSEPPGIVQAYQAMLNAGIIRRGQLNQIGRAHV